MGVIAIFKYMNIEAERARLGLTKEELAKKLGISVKTYYNWIGGAKPMPHTKLKEMSQMFGVKVDYLVEEHEETDKDAS